MLQDVSWKPIYFGVARSKFKVEAQKQNRRGFLHFYECWILLVYLHFAAERQSGAGTARDHAGKIRGNRFHASVRSGATVRRRATRSGPPAVVVRRSAAVRPASVWIGLDAARRCVRRHDDPPLRRRPARRDGVPAAGRCPGDDAPQSRAKRRLCADDHDVDDAVQSTDIEFDVVANVRATVGSRSLYRRRAVGLLPGRHRDLYGQHGLVDDGRPTSGVDWESR